MRQGFWIIFIECWRIFDCWLCVGIRYSKLREEEKEDLNEEKRWGTQAVNKIVSSSCSAVLTQSYSHFLGKEEEKLVGTRQLDTRNVVVNFLHSMIPFPFTCHNGFFFEEMHSIFSTTDALLRRYRRNFNCTQRYQPKLSTLPALFVFFSSSPLRARLYRRARHSRHDWSWGTINRPTGFLVRL